MCWAWKREECVTSRSFITAVTGVSESCPTRGHTPTRKKEAKRRQPTYHCAEMIDTSGKGRQRRLPSLVCSNGRHTCSTNGTPTQQCGAIRD
ncbi:hypothetical protein V5799_021769 [Amblyomma americanum]|uniref:Uncharacterized protein n=1 Tax=Amblyomma americanum TaxID=6943 RepID=A0AAQ4FMX5_AMBAM